MTEVGDIYHRKRFEGLRRFLDRYDSVDEAEQHSRSDFTITQARLFGQYYSQKQEQRGIKFHFFTRRGKRVKVRRDRRGRFTK